MTVRARLTTDAVDAGQPWTEDPDLQALAILFTTNPQVTFDQAGYYASATSLEAAQANGEDLPTAARALVAHLNGTAVLLIPDHAAVRWSGGIDSPGSVSAFTGTIRYRVRAPRDLSAADPASADAVLAAAAADPALARVLDLLARIEGPWVWFDLWRIWEWLRGRTYPIGQTFETWVNDDQARWDFKRSANDPAVSGDLARHDGGKHETRGKQMSSAAALTFITDLVARWVEESTGTPLVRVELSP